MVQVVLHQGHFILRCAIAWTLISLIQRYLMAEWIFPLGRWQCGQRRSSFSSVLTDAIMYDHFWSPYLLCFLFHIGKETYFFTPQPLNLGQLPRKNEGFCSIGLSIRRDTNKKIQFLANVLNVHMCKIGVFIAKDKVSIF